LSHNLPIYQKLLDGKENIVHIRILITVFIACFAVIETAPAALKVGLIYDVTGRGDLSFCDAAYAGAKKRRTNGDLNSQRSPQAKVQIPN